MMRPTHCRTCHNALPAIARFCPRCGQRVKPGRRRRRGAVLFVGLLGFCTFKAVQSPTRSQPPVEEPTVQPADDRLAEAPPTPLLPKIPFRH